MILGSYRAVLELVSLTVALSRSEDSVNSFRVPICLFNSKRVNLSEVAVDSEVV
jgi:hypothetical protein